MTTSEPSDPVDLNRFLLGVKNLLRGERLEEEQTQEPPDDRCWSAGFYAGWYLRKATAPFVEFANGVKRGWEGQ